MKEKEERSRHSNSSSLQVEKESTASDAGVDFVLVTALPEERDAVLRELPECQKLSPTEEDIRIYFRADLPVTFPNSSTGKYRVIVMSLLGMGRVQAVAATADAIRRWHPRYILLVGIAGGIAARNVRIGDIIISDQIVDYELQKLTSAGPEIRWEVHRADPKLLNACNNYQDEGWKKSIKIKRPDKRQPGHYIGPIASGDKVITFREIPAGYRNVWPKLIGVEMEAAGVATAAFQSAEQPGFFMVRGVSDLADENKDSKDVEKWRSYACAAAASFAIAFLKSGPVPVSKSPSQDNHILPGEESDIKNKVSLLSGSIAVGGNVAGSTFIIAKNINISTSGWDLTAGNTKLADFKTSNKFFLNGEERQSPPTDALDKDLHFSPLLLGPLIQNYNRYQQMAEESKGSEETNNDEFHHYNQERAMSDIRFASQSRWVVELYGPSGIGKSRVINTIVNEKDRDKFNTSQENWGHWKYVQISPVNNFAKLMRGFIDGMGSPRTHTQPTTPSSLQESLAVCISERIGAEQFDHFLFVIDGTDEIDDRTLLLLVGDDGPVGTKVRNGLKRYPKLILRLLISARRPRLSESYCREHHIWGLHQVPMDALGANYVKDMFYESLRPDIRLTIGRDVIDEATRKIYEITGGHPGAVTRILQEFRDTYQFTLEPEEFPQKFLPSILQMVQRDIISSLTLEEYFLGNVLSVLRHFSVGLVIKLFETNLLPSNIVNLKESDIDLNKEVRKWLDQLGESSALIHKVPGDLTLFQMHPILRHVLPMDLRWHWKEYLRQLHHAIFNIYDEQLQARLLDGIRQQLSFTHLPTYTIEALYHLFQYLSSDPDSFSGSELLKAAQDYYNLYAEAYLEGQDPNRDPYALRDKWINEIELKDQIQQMPNGQSILAQLEKILTEIP